MKITETQIRKLVKEAIQEKLNQIKDEKLFESSDFTARRQIMAAAGSTAMSFENEIVKLLGLVKPDNLEPHMQKKYLDIVNDMKSKITSAVAEAVNKMATLPRVNENSETVE